MQKHWRILVLGVIVSGAAIYMIASQINMNLLVSALQTANFLPLIPAAILAGVGLLARAQRWRVLLSDSLPLGRSFHILNIAYLVNGLLPFRIGEVARMWLAARGNVPVFKSAGTIVIERLLDVLMVVIFLAVALAAGPVPDQLRLGGITTGVIAFSGFLFSIFLASRRELAHRILNFFVDRIAFLKRLNLTTWFDHFLDGLKPLAHPASLFNALLWTAISWGFSFATGYLMMYAYYPQGDIIATFMFIASASFAVALPAVPGNVGPYEGSILLAMGALGYTSTDSGFATATAFALTVHFVNLGVNAILGVIGFIAEGVSLDQLSRGVEQMRETQNSTAG